MQKIDLTGAPGNSGRALLSHRENFNAHGWDSLSLYLVDTGGASAVWQLVPVFDGDREQASISVSGGADCLLQDFRLIAATRGHAAQLLRAEREPGDSFASAAQVTFKRYELRKNADQEIGRPMYYFELAATRHAKQNYCDVGEAFQKELGLGPYRAVDR